MQDKVFSPYIWCLNIWGCIKLAYDAPNQIALNQTMWSKTKACIAKCRQKREQSMTKVSTFFFLDLVHLLIL